MKRTDRQREAITETSWEVREAKRLAGDSQGLDDFWEKRWIDDYSFILDELPEFGRHGVIAELINRVVVRGKVLDVGCGTGILAELIDQERFLYTGIDVSRTALAIANRKRGRKGVTFVRGRIEEFSPQDQFSAVVFGEVLYYLEAAKVLRQVNSWLTPPAMIVASVFSFPEGDALLPLLHQDLDIICEASVCNSLKSHKWSVCAGVLKAGAR